MSRAPVVAPSRVPCSHHGDSIASLRRTPQTGRSIASDPTAISCTSAVVSPPPSPERGACMYPVLLLALLQHPATAPGFPVAQVEITPATAAVEVGQKVQLSARALDAGGQPIPAATVRWFVASDVGSVDSSGLVTGGYSGVVRVAAVA